MRKLNQALSIILVLGVLVSFTGCAAMRDWLSAARGALIGQSFTINTFSNAGELTMTTNGNKISIGLYENSVNKNAEEGGFKSEVLDITIDGSQILTVGSTLIFEEEGIDAVKDLRQERLDVIDTISGGGFIPLDKLINNLKNDIGKSRVVVVSSQLGNPICVYQGNDVYVSVPKDLPKMTRLNIDGKSLYIHRANYQIIDSNLIQ